MCGCGCLGINHETRRGSTREGKEVLKKDMAESKKGLKGGQMVKGSKHGDRGETSTKFIYENGVIKPVTLSV